MTDPTLDDVEPVYVKMVNCDSHWTDDHGICQRCRLACGYVTVQDPVHGGTRPRKQPKPHQRPAPVYALNDPSECSCGGWHGTPVSIERQTDGSEELLLSFQGRVDDIERNQANLVDQVLLMNEKLDAIIAQLGASPTEG